MKYSEGTRRLGAFRQRIAALRNRMRRVQKRTEPQPVDDYVFSTVQGTIRLSRLPYCTLWADGYNGLYEHIASRAAFVISSPDPPTVQRRFARGRGWRFPMVSHEGTSFAQDMGYRSRSGGWLPGISAFRRERGRIVRVSDTGSSPGDDFCALWHVLDLLPHGSAGWQPKFHYRSAGRGA